MKRWYSKLVLALMSLFIISAAYSKPTSTPIKVGITMSPPFVFKQHTVYDGIAIKIWKNIANINHIRYKFIPLTSNINDALKLLQQGKIDVLVGDISISQPRLQHVDFSRPYFINSVSLALSKKTLSLFDLFNYYLSLKIFKIILLLLLFYIATSHVFWLAEKDKNKAIKKSYWRGILSVMWIIIFNLLRGASLNKPETSIGKNIVLIWLAFGFISLVLITANLTSEITADKIRNLSDIQTHAQLRGKKIATVKGRLSTETAKKLGAKTVITTNLPQALQLLNEHKVDGVIEDHIFMSKLINHKTYPNVFISNLTIKHEEFAFATQKNSKLLATINKGITSLQDNGHALAICEQYISKKKALFCQL